MYFLADCIVLIIFFSFSTNPQRIYDLYNSVGYNCFIAAAVYILFGAFACCQMRLNKQKVISFISIF